MDFKASEGVQGETGEAGTDNDVSIAETGESRADGKAMTMEKADTGTDSLIAAKGAEALAGAMGAAAQEAAAQKAVPDSKKVNPRRFSITTDESRDANLTEFGKETLTDRYLLPGEKYQDLFARVADAYADDQDHAQRLYDYISNLWFMPATPVLSNGGTARGLPISCYLNSVSDSLDGIVGTWNENVWLASKGGGIGTYWGNVRGIGEPVGLNGKTSGIIPFVRVMDSLTLAISQGSLRRGSAACYLDVSHPEIEEF
ncbi:MAG: ribonucleotide reductase N-terminal alpha domain-containing protein, partial [Erythrobacter sp.]